MFWGRHRHGDVSYANFLFAGILIQSLAFGANYTTINLAVDMKEGIVDRFRSLPMSGSALIIGHIAADLVRNVITGIIIILAGFAVGFRPNAGVVEWLYVIGLSLLFRWPSRGCRLSGCRQSLEARNGAASVISPADFRTSAFVPPKCRSHPRFRENQPITHHHTQIRAWLVAPRWVTSA